MEHLNENEIEVYNPAKAAVAKAVADLDPMIFTDKRGRDGLFNACVEANKVKKLIGDKRLELTRPLDTKKKQIKTLFDGLTAELEAVLAKKRKLITEFDAEQKRKAAEELAKLEAERLAKEKEKENLSGIAKKKAEAYTSNIQEKLQQVYQKAELKGSRKARIKFHLVDIEKVPAEYIERVVNWNKVSFAASNGVKEIPGLRAEVVHQTVFAGRA